MCSIRLVTCPFWGSICSSVNQDIGRLFLGRHQTSETASRWKKKNPPKTSLDSQWVCWGHSQECGSLNGSCASPGQVTGNFTSYRMVPTQSTVLLYKPWGWWPPWGPCYWILWALSLAFHKGPAMGPILWGTHSGDQRSSDSRWRPCPTWRNQLTAMLHKLNSTTHDSWSVIEMHDNNTCHIFRQHLLSEWHIDQLILALFVSFGWSSEYTMLMLPRIMATTASPTEA